MPSSGKSTRSALESRTSRFPLRATLSSASAMPHSPWCAMTTPRRLPNELVIVWVLFALVTLAVLVTYARLGPEELYRVSGTGLAAGLSRALVYVNFPVGIAALAALVVLFDRLRSRGLRIAVVVAATLCAVVFWPGVIDQGNLDAKWVNAVPALGVGLAVLLTVHAVR